MFSYCINCCYVTIKYGSKYEKKHLIFSPKIVKKMGVGSGFLASQNGKESGNRKRTYMYFLAVLVGMEYIYIHVVLPCILQYNITKSKKSGR